jgi:hypothetical protein
VGATKMIDRKKDISKDEGFNFDMKIGQLTLVELALIVCGFIMAITVLVQAISHIEGIL